MNRIRIRLMMLAAVLACFAGALPGQQTAPAKTTTKQYVFPAKGQSPEQQKKDVADCEAWAIDETGFDPSKPIVYQPPAPPPQQAGPSTGRSMVRGAAAGYIIGDIANDEGGEGAAIGAAAGAVASNRRKKQASQAQAQAQSADQQAFEQDVAAMKQEHSKARAVCLEAKGYTVK